MKRNSDGLPVHITWKHCFICQKTGKKDLTGSDDTLQTLANFITEFRNLGQIEELVWDAINTVVDDKGNRSSAPTLYHSLKKNSACFHRSCGSNYNKQKLDRLKKKLNDEKQQSTSAPTTRLSIEKKDFASNFCAICNQEDVPENLHARGTFHASKRKPDSKQNQTATKNWKEMALKAGNDVLLNHIIIGDSSSSELFYHKKCNDDLYNECIRIDKDNNGREIEMKWRKAQAFESVVSFILGQEAVEPGSIFLVMDLNKLYIENLKSFGITEQTQTTRFKERLLCSIPNLVARIVNKNTVVLFDEKVHELIVEYVKNPDEFYAALRKVVQPIRADIMKQENKFTGTFNSSSQVQAVPKTVLALTSALIDDEMTSSNQPSQEALSVAQIIVSQMRRPSKRKAVVKKPTRRRHNLHQETPLLQYVGLKIFYSVRSRQLIEDFYYIGLSVSYDRVLELIKMFYEELRRAYISHNFFFPRILRRFLFTVWLKDNIDVNPKANFNKSSYHGTSSSIVQFRTTEDEGEEFPSIQFVGNITKESKKLAPLPPEYTCVKDVYPAKFKTDL